MGPARAGADCGARGVRGVIGGERGRLMAEEDGEDVADDVGVPAKEEEGDESEGTTSG